MRTNQRPAFHPLGSLGPSSSWAEALDRKSHSGASISGMDTLQGGTGKRSARDANGSSRRSSSCLSRPFQARTYREGWQGPSRVHEGAFSQLVQICCSAEQLVMRPSGPTGWPLGRGTKVGTPTLPPTEKKEFAHQKTSSDKSSLRQLTLKPISPEGTNKGDSSPRRKAQQLFTPPQQTRNDGMVNGHCFVSTRSGMRETSKHRHVRQALDCWSAYPELWPNSAMAPSAIRHDTDRISLRYRKGFDGPNGEGGGSALVDSPTVAHC